MNEPIKLRDGDAILVMIKDGKLLHHSWNMSLPHVEFVRRATGQVPAGAWVGTVSKVEGRVAAMSSKYFYGYQMPAPPEVDDVVSHDFV